MSVNWTHVPDSIREIIEHVMEKTAGTATAKEVPGRPGYRCIEVRDANGDELARLEWMITLFQPPAG